MPMVSAMLAIFMGRLTKSKPSMIKLNSKINKNQITQCYGIQEKINLCSMAGFYERNNYISATDLRQLMRKLLKSNNNQKGVGI